MVGFLVTISYCTVDTTVVPPFTGPSAEWTPAIPGHNLNVNIPLMRGHLVDADSGQDILVLVRAKADNLK